jgi:flagellar biosynthetic protein FlhB
MADQDDNRTEQPTGKRRSQAFRKGQFAQAPEIPIAFGLAAGFCVLLFAMPAVAQTTTQIAVYLFGHLHDFEISASSVPHYLQQSGMILGGLIFPIVGTAMLAGIVAGGLQTGFRLTPDVIQLSWGRLNPATGVKRIASKDMLIRFGIDVLKLLAFALILWGAARHVLQDPIFYTPVGILHLGEFINDTSLYVLVRIIIALAVIAFISYLYQRRKTTKDLMMTRDEVRQERKNADIDPKVRNAQRALARRILQRQMLRSVPTADVVVTNPTHFAVALKYERGRDRAPIVLAKGHNLLARRIKAIAKEHGVPMVENKPIARALFKFGQVGREIPVQLYQAVAEILGFVYRAHRYYFHRLKARRLGQIVT